MYIVLASTALYIEREKLDLVTIRVIANLLLLVNRKTSIFSVDGKYFVDIYIYKYGRNGKKKMEYRCSQRNSKDSSVVCDKQKLRCRP